MHAQPAKLRSIRSLGPALSTLAAASFVLALAACTETYHPEYHPVTVSEVSQNLNYPVVVHNSGSPSERSPVYVGQGPAPVLATPPPPPPQQPVLPPAEWFRGGCERANAMRRVAPSGDGTVPGQPPSSEGTRAIASAALSMILEPPL